MSTDILSQKTPARNDEQTPKQKTPPSQGIEVNRGGIVVYLAPEQAALLAAACDEVGDNVTEHNEHELTIFSSMSALFKAAACAAICQSFMLISDQEKAAAILAEYLRGGKNEH